MKAVPESPSAPAFLRYTADIVAAHVLRNQVPVAGLPALIQAVHAALSGLIALDAPAEAPRTPAVPIKRSVFPDYIVCLEDGRQLKMLKRHLHTAYGLTPDVYRERWGLPANYPMTAPNYGKLRSVLAKKTGLGRKAVAEPVVQQVPVGRSGVRKRKAKAPG